MKDINTIILPINKAPSITSYVQHSYTNAIADDDSIATIYVENVQDVDWSFQDNDICYEINAESEEVSLRGKPGWTSTSFYMRRLCNEEDEIIVKLSEMKLLDALSFIRLSISTEKEFLNQDDSDFFFRWNQYDITLKDMHISYDSHLLLYYKLNRLEDAIQVSVSHNKKDWDILIADTDILKNGNGNSYFYVQVYFGDNQYDKWKSMNYIQLFYNASDRNGVFLDYFMFPRKGVDASYQYLCHFLDTEYIEWNQCMGAYKSIHEYIKHSIQNGYYLNISLDEYYIPNRRVFGIYHYDHFNLFYGYDDELQEYSILGYNEKGKLDTSVIPYRVLLEQNYGNYIVRYKYKVNSVPYEFNISYVIQSIKEFLYGMDSGLKFAGMLSNRKGTYGIRVFDELGNTKEGRGLLIRDKRISFVLYEHCCLMRERLGYLQNRGYLPENVKVDIYGQCSEMVQNAEKLKNMVIKNQMVPKYENEIMRLLEVLYHSEKYFYNNLLRLLQ